MTVNEIYDMLEGFIGYGNPSGLYWFIGMEENWSLNCVNDVRKIITPYDIEYYSKSIQPLSLGSYTFCKFLERCKKYGTYESGFKKILELKENETINFENLNDKFFSTNAYLFPDREEENIKRVFSITDFETHKRVEEVRRKNIFMLWKSSANSKRITLCLSIGYEQIFCDMFSIDFISNEKNSRIKYARMENGEYIILLAHPSSGKYFTKYLEELKLFLRKIS